MSAKIIQQPESAPFPISKEEVIELYYNQQQDLTYIAQITKSSRQRVARWMEFWGLKRRSCIEACVMKRKQKGQERGPNWRGGRWYQKGLGQWKVYAPYHPKCSHNGCYFEHLILAETKLNRFLKDDEIVHHLDNDSSNNDINNLSVMTKSQHLILHRYLGFAGIKILIKNPTLIADFPEGAGKEITQKIYIEKIFNITGE